MFTQQLRKVGDNYVINVPVEEIERLNVTEGQLLIIEIQPVETRLPTLQEAFEQSWQHNEEGYRYLENR